MCRHSPYLDGLNAAGSKRGCRLAVAARGLSVWKLFCCKVVHKSALSESEEGDTDGTACEGRLRCVPTFANTLSHSHTSYSSRHSLVSPHTQIDLHQIKLPLSYRCWPHPHSYYPQARRARGPRRWRALCSPPGSLRSLRSRWWRPPPRRACAGERGLWSDLGQAWGGPGCVSGARELILRAASLRAPWAHVAITAVRLGQPVAWAAPFARLCTQRRCRSSSSSASA